MVAKITVEQRAGIFGQAVNLMLADLPMIAAEQHDFDDAERASWSLVWGYAMAAQLGELDELYRRGDLSAEHVMRYRTLIEQRKESLPVIHRLNFFPPPVSLSPDDVTV